MLGSHTSASSDSSVLALHRQLLSKSSDVSAAQRIRNGHPSTTTKDKMISWRPWYYVCWKIHGKPVDWKPTRERRAYFATVSDQSTSVSQPFTGTTWITSQAIWIATISVVAFCVWYGHTAIQGDIPLASLTITEWFFTLLDNRFWYIRDHMSGQLHFSPHTATFILQNQYGLQMGLVLERSARVQCGYPHSYP